MAAILLYRPTAATLTSRFWPSHFLPAAVVLAGVGVAMGIATAPTAVLDGAVERLHLAALLPAAAAPIGVTGRCLLALGLGLLIASTALLGRLRRPASISLGYRDAPIVRRADAHPDAPPRRPIRASEDLGQPLPDPESAGRRIIMTPDEPQPPAIAAPVVAVDAPAATTPAAPFRDPDATWMTPPPERTLPRDLDLPMSVFDPGAVPAAPMAPPEPVPPLFAAPRPAVARVDRIESFTIPAESTSSPAAAEATIESLLDRLERSAERRAAVRSAPAPTPAMACEPEQTASLDETLQRLRRLAAS
ncbi:hypothetical protein [Sphingomonas sp.]|jgi:hypothetical protein|uniref:hypothetical protein n=1 Tax=Sphingomonas sp. TaxID=28214 RepID=UPI0035C80263